MPKNAGTGRSRSRALERFLRPPGRLLPGLCGFLVRRGALIRSRFAFIHNPDISCKLLVLCVADHHLYVHDRTSLEDEVVVGVNVGWKPVLAVDVLAIRFKVRKGLVLYLRDGLTNGFYYLQVLVVDPYSTLEIALPLDELPRFYVKGISVQLIHSLFPGIIDLIFGEIFEGQSERLDPRKVLHILRRYSDLRKTGCGEIGDLLDPRTSVVVNDVRDSMI